jgi:hypothetical protein
MATVSEHPDQSAQAEPAELSLQSDKTKAIVEEIEAGNAALKEADETAEAAAEAVVEQAQQLVEAVDEVLEELRETQPGSGHE